MITDSLWEFCTAGKIKFGDEAVEEAGWEAKRLGGSRILVITDRGIAKAGLADKVKSSLEKENLEVNVFDDVQPDPPLQVYNDCLTYARQQEHDLVVGLGGGSSMDVAKVTATLLTQGGEPLDYVAKPTGKGLPIRKGLPNIAVPTTSGTGSEVSPVAVITLPEKELKVGISNNYIRPDVALVDPLMTVTVPPLVTASTGMDALAHAIEAYTTRRYDCRLRPER
ncbi:MAG: iron-containing alcohol dehydrogenase, partial [Candidatus Bathyarchaeota archaeon]|nr:iron-containing alcohol dehydrogenase [Candidatus Bathyarchaeota archaeon]